MSEKGSNQLAFQPVSRSITCCSKFLCLPVVSSCCPRSTGCATNDASFGGYGSSEVRTLAAHYYPTETNNKKLHAEWNNLKFKLVE